MKSHWLVNKVVVRKSPFIRQILQEMQNVHQVHHVILNGGIDGTNDYEIAIGQSRPFILYLR